jgi:L-threonylcarbamoyladenylate synthase
MAFKEKVFQVVRKIKAGDFLSYKKVAKRAGNERAYRAVANILKNSPENVPCHRVIRNDSLVGGYMGRKNLDWLKAALLLKEGAVGVIPTDTIYGICANAFNKKSVEKVYKLRKRNPNKSCIILISNFDNLKKFNVKLSSWQRKILKKICPGKISVVLGPLAFRLPKEKLILDILKISGPLIAPSANWAGCEPAKNIKEAKKYFGNKVFYLDRGDLISKPSTLINLGEKRVRILREGEEVDKIYRLLRTYI